MDLHAHAPPAAWPRPWASIFATPELWKPIADIVDAPRYHGHCYACNHTDIGNLQSIGRFLLCSTGIAGKYDGECLCRRCGQSVEVPQTLFARLAEANRAWTDRWDRSVLIQAVIHRVADCHKELAEITQYRNGMSPRTRALYHNDMSEHIRVCKGNPLDQDEESGTPTDIC